MELNAINLQIISNVLLFAGTIVAACTIGYNIRTARRTQTAIFLFESRKDQEYITAIHTLKDLKDSGKSLRSYVFPPTGKQTSQAEKDEGRRVQYILNFYERVAVSIKAGIYDEKMIKKTSFSTVMDTYETADPMIRAIREKARSSTVYQEYEWLYNRWKRCPLTQNKHK